MLTEIGSVHAPIFSFRNPKRLSVTTFSGAQPELMTKQFTSIARSFIIIPMLASSLSMTVFTTTVQNAVLASKDTAPAPSAEELKAETERVECAAKIDAYFSQYKLPLAGHGMTFATEAQKNGIPCTLLAAIGMAESTGGKFVIPGTNNSFGWGGGRIKFASTDAAIAEISAHLGGNDAATAQYYDNKSLEQILHTYNPPRIAPEYEANVMYIMKAIDAMPLS